MDVGSEILRGFKLGFLAEEKHSEKKNGGLELLTESCALNLWWIRVCAVWRIYILEN